MSKNTVILRLPESAEAATVMRAVLALADALECSLSVGDKDELVLEPRDGRKRRKAGQTKDSP